MFPRRAFVILVAMTTASTVMSVNVSCDSLTLQSLLTLVQHQMTTLEQQAATIMTMQSQLTNLQTSSLQQAHSISGLQAKVTQRLDAFRARLQAQANMGKVAFTAHMSATGVNVGANGPFIFDAVTTNIGDSYNPHSGIFVAPYDGVYVFSFIMNNDGAASTIHAQIEKDGVVLGVGTSDGMGASNKWDDGSALVTTRLKKGDHVYVKRRDGSTRVYGNVYTNFSGFLLSADA